MTPLNQTPLLSIIICAYNVERFMRRGLDSLFAMSGDYEVVICDDGSTDATGKIADEYAQCHENLRVVHQANTGLGGARNTAIDAAVGKYIAFYDVDDVLADNYFDVLEKALKPVQPDLLMFGYEEINEYYHTSDSFTFDTALYSDNQQMADAYVDAFSGVRFNNGFTWNKLYRREFLVVNNIRFGNQRIQQDEVFNCNVYKRANSMKIIPDVLYRYFIYQSGNNRSRYIENRLDIYREVRDALLSLADYWQVNDQRLYRYINRRFFMSVLEYMNFNLHHKQCPLSAMERADAIISTMKSNDVIECCKWLTGQSLLAPRLRKYADVILSKNLRKYERMIKTDNVKSDLRRQLHRIKNMMLRKYLFASLISITIE